MAAFHIPQDTAQWMAAEWQDYIAPRNWTVKKQKDGRATLSKKDDGSHGPTQYKVSGPIPARLDRLVNIVHTNASTYDRHLDPNVMQSTVLQRITKEQLGGLADEGVVYYRQAKLPFVDNRDFVTLTLMKITHNPQGHRVVAFFSRSVEHPSAPRPPSGFTRAHVISCCAFLEETPQGVVYTFSNKTDPHIKMMSHAVNHGTESFMMDYFSRLSQLSTQM